MVTGMTCGLPGSCLPSWTRELLGVRALGPGGGARSSWF